MVLTFLKNSFLFISPAKDAFIWKKKLQRVLYIFQFEYEKDFLMNPLTVFLQSMYILYSFYSSMQK